MTGFSGFLLFSLTDYVIIPIRMGIEKEGVILDLAVDISLIRKPDVAQTVGGHMATVTVLRLESLELISIETAQAVPGCKPHESIIVLQQLGDMIRWYAILLVI